MSPENPKQTEEVTSRIVRIIQTENGRLKVENGRLEEELRRAQRLIVAAENGRFIEEPSGDPPAIPILDSLPQPQILLPEVVPALELPVETLSPTAKPEQRDDEERVADIRPLNDNDSEVGRPPETADGASSDQPPPTSSDPFVIVPDRTTYTSEQIAEIVSRIGPPESTPDKLGRAEEQSDPGSPTPRPERGKGFLTRHIPLIGLIVGIPTVIGTYGLILNNFLGTDKPDSKRTSTPTPTLSATPYPEGTPYPDGTPMPQLIPDPTRTRTQAEEIIALATRQAAVRTPLSTERKLNKSIQDQLLADLAAKNIDLKITYQIGESNTALFKKAWIENNLAAEEGRPLPHKKLPPPRSGPESLRNVNALQFDFGMSDIVNSKEVSTFIRAVYEFDQNPYYKRIKMDQETFENTPQGLVVVIKNHPDLPNPNGWTVWITDGFSEKAGDVVFGSEWGWLTSKEIKRTNREWAVYALVTSVKPNTPTPKSTSVFTPTSKPDSTPNLTPTVIGRIKSILRFPLVANP